MIYSKCNLILFMKLSNFYFIMHELVIVYGCGIVLTPLQ